MFQNQINQQHIVKEIDLIEINKQSLNGYKKPNGIHLYQNKNRQM